MKHASPHRLFLVDNHALVRELLAEILEAQAGLKVCGMAGSGSEALAVMSECDCDLAIIDVSMPKMSGIELVRALRKRGLGVPCIMLTGHPHSLYVERALAAGARGFVVKGSIREVLDAVAAVLAGGVYVDQSLGSLTSVGAVQAPQRESPVVD